MWNDSRFRLAACSAGCQREGSLPQAAPLCRSSNDDILFQRDSVEIQLLIFNRRCKYLV